MLGLPAGAPALRVARRVRDAGAVGLRRSHGAREPRVLRAHRSASAAIACRRSSSGSAWRRRRIGSSSTLSGGAAREGLPRHRSARTNRTCSSSTSPRLASTRCCGAICGTSSTSSPTGGTTLLVSSHVMDEAARCDRLLSCGRVDPGRRDAGRAARANRDARARRRVPASDRRRGVGMSLAHQRRDRRPCALAAPSRPAHDRAHPRRARRPALPRRPAVRRPAAGVPGRSESPLLGLFPLVIMFLVTSITMLRERTSGTLERLLTMPLAKLDLLARLRARLRARRDRAGGARLGGRVRPPRPRTSPHSTLLIVALAVANAILGMALGLFVSAFARTEFQAVQFMPAFILPQILLCGLFVPRDQMADVAPVAIRGDAVHLCVRRADAGGDGSDARRAVLGGRRGRRRRDAAVPGARRGDAPAPDPVALRSP